MAYHYKTSKGLQHRARPASFRRIAKDCRVAARDYPRRSQQASDWRELGRIFDDEAKLLRSMR